LKSSAAMVESDTLLILRSDLTRRVSCPEAICERKDDMKKNIMNVTFLIFS